MKKCIHNTILKRLIVVLALSSSFAFGLDLSGVGSMASQHQKDGEAAADAMNGAIGDAIAKLEAEKENKSQVTINVPYDLEAIPEGFAPPEHPDKPFTGYRMTCNLYTSEDESISEKIIDINNLQGTATFKWYSIPHQDLLKLSKYSCYIRFTGAGTSNLTPNTTGLTDALKTINYRSTGSFE